jgi:mannose/cellobiose epimerase-like protein (N-acyl-D-glucosamine 2-epimerase family)
MIDITEASGVKDGLALQQVLDDFSPHDGSARLWPQTERLKAAALAARLTGEAKYFAMTISAAQSLRRYLATPIAGLWFDRIDVDGRVVNEPAPASTFYHLVVAVAEISALARLI